MHVLHGVKAADTRLGEDCMEHGQRWAMGWCTGDTGWMGGRQHETACQCKLASSATFGHRVWLSLVHGEPEWATGRMGMGLRRSVCDDCAFTSPRHRYICDRPASTESPETERIGYELGRTGD